MFVQTIVNPNNIVATAIKGLEPLLELQFGENRESQKLMLEQVGDWLHKSYQENPEVRKKLRACRRRRENRNLPTGSKLEQAEGITWLVARTTARIHHLLKNSIEAVIVHPGTFHADDAFATAAMQLLIPGVPVLRKDPTPEECANPKIVVLDIGGIYNPGKRCFDHHQRKGSAGDETPRPEHAEDYPMAAFGLVWDTFGESIVLDATNGEESNRVAEKVQYALVRHVDAEDNGKNTEPFTVSKMISRMNMQFSDKNQSFQFAVDTAKEIILREIRWHQEALNAAATVRELIEKTPGHILEFPQHYVWKNPASFEDRIWFAVYPSDRRGWVVECASPKGQPMEQKVPMPEWTISNLEMREQYGIIFSHTGHFLAVCDNRENALRLANKIVEDTKKEPAGAGS